MQERRSRQAQGLQCEHPVGKGASSQGVQHVRGVCSTHRIENHFADKAVLKSMLSFVNTHFAWTHRSPCVCTVM